MSLLSDLLETLLNHFLHKIKVFLGPVLSIAFCITLFAHTANALNIIRDDEIETVLMDITVPIVRVASLDPDAMTLFIVQDDSINAFVAGGMNIYFHTGLLTLSDSPEMIVGVIAHEIGHISGGHLVNRKNAFDDLSIQSVAGYLLGAAAAIAGSPQAGSAIMSGSSQITNRRMLKYSRTQEESADQAALHYLESLHYSASGLIDVLKYLRQEQNRLFRKIDPFATTHPLSRERIALIEAHLKTSPHTDTPFPEELSRSFKLSITKLKAFLTPPKETLQQYNEEIPSEVSDYAKAIAYHKIPKREKALFYINRLINAHPKNPYYHELKGQILFENGLVLEAIPHYQKALSIKPTSALFHIILGQALIATEDFNHLNDAITHLKQGIGFEPRNTFAWQQLAIAYGRQNKLGKSYLALAEKAAIQKNKKEMVRFIKLTEEQLKDDMSASLRIQDIKKQLSNL